MYLEKESRENGYTRVTSRVSHHIWAESIGLGLMLLPIVRVLLALSLYARNRQVLNVIVALLVLVDRLKAGMDGSKGECALKGKLKASFRRT
jgi:uncharacterized membrane protein